MAVESFVGVRVQGGLLPAELLSRLQADQLGGQEPGTYHLAAGESVREAANRAWAYLTGVWAAYRQAAATLPETDRGTTLTRERWLLILLRELDYGRVPTTGGMVMDGKRVPITHAWQQVPIHLLGHRIDLDRRTPGVAGAASSGSADHRAIWRWLVPRLGIGRSRRTDSPSGGLCGPVLARFWAG